MAKAKDNAALLDKKLGNLGKVWKKARTVDPKGNFEDPDVPDGTYSARIDSAKLGLTQKEDLTFEIKLVIEGGEYDATKVRIFHMLKGDDEEALQKKLEFLAKDLKRAGYEIDDLDPADLKDIAAHMTENKQLLEISTKQGEDKQKNRRLNVYINKLVGAEKSETNGKSKKKGKK